MQLWSNRPCRRCFEHEIKTEILPKKDTTNPAQESAHLYEIFTLALL